MPALSFAARLPFCLGGAVLLTTAAGLDFLADFTGLDGRLALLNDFLFFGGMTLSRSREKQSGVKGSFYGNDVFHAGNGPGSGRNDGRGIEFGERAKRLQTAQT